MGWQIEFLPEAAKELKTLDRQVAARIIQTLEERIAPLDDPRAIGGGWSAIMRACGARGSAITVWSPGSKTSA